MVCIPIIFSSLITCVPEGAKGAMTTMARYLRASLCVNWQQGHDVWGKLMLRCGQAISAHDRVIRSLMAQHHGFEVCTEGDAFLVAFHTPEDACAWCVAVQQVS